MARFTQLFFSFLGLTLIAGDCLGAEKERKKEVAQIQKKQLLSKDEQQALNEKLNKELESYSNDTAAFKELIKQGADINAIFDDAPLSFRMWLLAKTEPDAEQMVTFLKQHGLNTRAKNEMGYTLLHNIFKYNKSMSGEIPITLVWIKPLLEKEDNLADVVDEEGNTLLHAVAKSNYGAPFINLLLKKGVPINAQNKQGETALISAAKKVKKYTTNHQLEYIGELDEELLALSHKLPNIFIEDNAGKDVLDYLTNIAYSNQLAAYVDLLERERDDYRSYLRGLTLTPVTQEDLKKQKKDKAIIMKQGDPKEIAKIYEVPRQPELRGLISEYLFGEGPKTPSLSQAPAQPGTQSKVVSLEEEMEEVE